MNKHGLGRTIPDSTKREVRQRCGFGCALCGNAIITYEHFDPPFKDAKVHHAKGITLLCGSHQLESSKGLLSKETIREADLNPACKRSGFAKHMLDFGKTKPHLVLGGADVTECAPTIEIDETLFFKVDAPDEDSQRWRLSCRFIDENGIEVCRIAENELLVKASCVDIEQSAKRLVIHSETMALLELEFEPPDGLRVKQYSTRTPNGRVLIGDELLPDIEHSLRFPDAPRIMRTCTVFKLETNDGNGVTLVNSRIESRGGLRISLLHGGVILSGT